MSEVVIYKEGGLVSSKVETILRLILTLTRNNQRHVQALLGLGVDLALVVPAVPGLDVADAEAPGHCGGGELGDLHPQSGVGAEHEASH